MAVTLYVGNLPWQLTEDELASALRPIAEVLDVRIITDPDTGRSRGFGFVELEGIQMQDALRAMESVEVKGRRLTVGPARPRPQRY